jgi:hypothetical protein
MITIRRFTDSAKGIPLKASEQRSEVGGRWSVVGGRWSVVGGREVGRDLGRAGGEDVPR